MMRRYQGLFALSALGCVLPLSCGGQSSPPLQLQWARLPAIPDRIGLAGSFAGIDQGLLIVAGGANFPDKAPWAGGTKTWHDRIFVLEKGGPAWKEMGRLPAPNGYGVSLSAPDGVLLIGGGDARHNFAGVLRLKLSDGKIAIDRLPDLPLPLAMAAGAILDGKVYIAGGVHDPAASHTQTVFLALDLRHPGAGWATLESWPGPGRMLATAAALDDSFYLIGGADLRIGADGRPARVWLRDVYAYTPHKGWRRLADLPRPVVAAPSPAIATPTRLLIFGGDDGSKLGIPPAEHPGFSRTVLAYDPQADAWSEAGALPFSLVTTPAIFDGECVVIPGGESRPGVRSTEVWRAALVAGRHHP
jgi:N-acetylneuraminate epimerase